MGPPFARRRRSPLHTATCSEGRDAGVVADARSAPTPVAQARATRGPGELEERRLRPDSNRETTTGIVSGLSLTRSKTPMNTRRQVSVGTDTGAPVPDRVPKQDAVSTIRELVNRLFAGDLDGETRTRTGDTTIFSRVVVRFSRVVVRMNPADLQGRSAFWGCLERPNFLGLCGHGTRCRLETATGGSTDIAWGPRPLRGGPAPAADRVADPAPRLVANGPGAVRDGVETPRRTRTGRCSRCGRRSA
jgi:hypothetical protein